MIFPNWSIKGEYQYISLRQGPVGAASEFAGGLGTAFVVTHRNPRIDMHTARIGLNYHFTLVLRPGSGRRTLLSAKQTSNDQARPSAGPFHFAGLISTNFLSIRMNRRSLAYHLARTRCNYACKWQFTRLLLKCAGGRLASGTKSWKRWPPVMTRRCR